MMLTAKKETMSDSMDGINAILREHEIRTNQKMNVLLIAILLLSFFMLTSLRFSWVSYDYSVSLIPYHCVNVIFLMISVVFITSTEGKNRYCKYMVVFSLLFVTFILNSHYASSYMVYVIPMIVCIAYRDKKMTAITSVVIAIVSFIATYVAVHIGVFDYNIIETTGMSDGSVIVKMTIDEIFWKTVTDSYIVFLVIHTIISVLSYVVTSKGLEIMKQKAVSDSMTMAMDKELTVASEIQKGMLPADSFDDNHCSICASMRAAKMVGGDYYDYFMPDDGHITVLIADVSGKGVPASLFMASAKTMMHSYAMRGMSPADVFDSVNRSLCESNPEKMFITAWMGTLDLETGRLTYANAGHNPPFMIRLNSAAEMIVSPPNFILGRKKGIRYKDRHLDMGLGDKLLLYTDGVTEAMNQDKDMYTSDRLNEVLGTISSEQPKDIISKICESVDGFTGDAQQSDDMTMVLLNYKEKYMCQDEPGETFVLNKDTYPEVISYITGRLKEGGCIEKTVTDFEICSSEILSNIDMYAYSGHGDGKVNVSVNISARSAKIVFTDFGPEYNPLKHSSPDSEKRISEHKIGGFGILIVKKMMDDVIYERKDEKNILTIKKEF